MKCVNISQDLEMKKLGFGSLFSRANFTVIIMKLSFLVESIANHSHKRWLCPNQRGLILDPTLLVETIYEKVWRRKG